MFEPNPAVYAAAEEVRRRLNPEAILLYGSHAQGQPDGFSDIDLIALCSFAPYLTGHGCVDHVVYQFHVLDAMDAFGPCSHPMHAMAYFALPIYDPQSIGQLFIQKVRASRQTAPMLSAQRKAQIEERYRALSMLATSGHPDSVAYRPAVLLEGIRVLAQRNDLYWFGDKLSLQAMNRDDPELYRLFRRCIDSQASKADLSAWCSAVLDAPACFDVRKLPSNMVNPSPVTEQEIFQRGLRPFIRDSAQLPPPQDPSDFLIGWEGQIRSLDRGGETGLWTRLSFLGATIERFQDFLTGTTCDLDPRPVIIWLQENDPTAISLLFQAMQPGATPDRIGEWGRYCGNLFTSRMES